jgi:hypothetical protein
MVPLGVRTWNTLDLQGYERSVLLLSGKVNAT